MKNFSNLDYLNFFNTIIYRENGTINLVSSLFNKRSVNSIINVSVHLFF